MSNIREFPKATAIQRDVNQFINQTGKNIADKDRKEYLEQLNQVLLERMGQKTSPSSLTQNQLTIRTTIQDELENNPKIQNYLTSARHFLDTPATDFMKGLKEFDAEQKKNKLAVIHDGLQFATMVGVVLKNEPIQKISMTAQSAVMMYQGYTALTAALASSSPILLSLGPVGMIGMGLLTVISIFSKKKSKHQEDPFPALVIQHLSFISSQLRTLQGSVNTVLQTQKHIYDAIWQTSELLDKMIKNEISNFRAPVLYSLERLEEVGLQTFSYLQRCMDATFWQKLGKLGDTTQHFIEESLSLNRVDLEILRAKQAKMMQWLRIDQNEHTKRILNDHELYETHKIGDRYKNICDSKALSFNYLMLLAEDFLEVPLQMPEDKRPEDKSAEESKKIKAIDIPNPATVLTAGVLYYDFRKTFQPFAQEFDPGNKNINHALHACEEILKSIRILQRTPALFEKLFQQYKETINEIKKIADNEMQLKSKEINNFIAETETKNVPEVKENEKLTLDIRDSFSDLMLDTEHSIQKVLEKGPLNPVIKGENYNTGRRTVSLGGVTAKFSDIKAELLLHCPTLFGKYILLERLKMGTLEFIFNADPGEFKVGIKFTYKDNLKTPVTITLNYTTTADTGETWSHDVQRMIRYYKRAGRSYSWPIDVTTAMKNYFAVKILKSINYSARLEELYNTAQTKLVTYLLEFKKQAIVNVFKADSGVRMDTACIKQDALIRLMKNYAMIIGISTEEFQQITKIPNSVAIKKHFANYLEQKELTIATEMPFVNIAHELPKIENTILEKIKIFNAEYFQSQLGDSLARLFLQLTILKEIPALSVDSTPDIATEEKHLVQVPASSNVKFDTDYLKIQESQAEIYLQLNYLAKQMTDTNLTNPCYAALCKHLKVAEGMFAAITESKRDHHMPAVKLVPLMLEFNAEILAMNRSLSFLNINRIGEDTARELRDLKDKLRNCAENKLQVPLLNSCGLFAKGDKREQSTSHDYHMGTVMLSRA